jgi:hypothetical protein
MSPPESTRPNGTSKCRPYRPEVGGAWVEFVARGSSLWRVVEFMACGRVCGAWSSLWRVVEFVARGRVCGAWSSLWLVVEFMARGRLHGWWSTGAWPARILDKPLPKITGLTVKG